jgi:hypothetical protein
MDKVYIYLGKEYKPRIKSFKHYRVQAIILLNKYNDFENMYTADLKAEINNFLFTDKKVMGKIISANNCEDTGKLNKAVEEVLKENPRYAIKAEELAKKKVMARELFLTTDGKGNVSDDNAKTLCEIMLEDSKDINHDVESETGYAEYLKFIFNLFQDFFLKYKV